MPPLATELNNPCLSKGWGIWDQHREPQRKCQPKWARWTTKVQFWRLSSKRCLALCAKQGRNLIVHVYQNCNYPLFRNMSHILNAFLKQLRRSSAFQIQAFSEQKREFAKKRLLTSRMLVQSWTFLGQEKLFFCTGFNLGEPGAVNRWWLVHDPHKFLFVYYDDTKFWEGGCVLALNRVID